MNKFKTIFGVFLGTAMLLGVGAAIAKLNNSEKKETKAATVGRFNILIHSNSWWKNDSAHIYAIYNDSNNFWNSGTTAQRITPDADLGTITNEFTWQDIGATNYGVLSMSVDFDSFTYGNFYFGRHNPANAVTVGDKSNAADWGKAEWVCNPTGIKSNNTVVIDGNNNFAQNWGNYWKMTAYSGKLSYDNVSGATKNCYLKSASYGFAPSDPDAPGGYEFVGWYTDKAFTNKWTSSSKMTADTTIYAKYSQVTAHFINTSGTLGNELTYNTANGQYEGTISVAANEKFAVRKTFASGNQDYYALDKDLPSSVAVVEGNYVKIISAGTYIVYFKWDNTMWIETAGASLVAYAYAGYFLTNVGCDATGASLPSGWSTVKSRYETAVTDEAKDYICEFDPASADEGDDIAEMLARYQIAIKQHPTLDNFLKNSDGEPKFASVRAFSIAQSIEPNNALTIITIIAAIGVLTIGAYMFFKKGKKVEQ